MRTIDLGLILTIVGVSACSAPAATPTSAVVPTAAATVPAPSSMVRTVSATTSSSPAKTCSIDGMSWRKWDSQINPKMTVSNDGFCGSDVHVSANTPVLAHLASEAAHGRIDTFGEGTSQGGFRYYPDQGYVGPDAFALVTGNARHEVVANFSVTVTQ
jgi:hypothetical protein